MTKANACLTLICALSYFCGLTLAQDRIVGGQISQIEDSPYVVSLHNNNVYYCTGTLISLQHVITAAACVVDVPIRQIVVKAARVNLNEENRQSRTVAQLFYPGAYDPITRFMDIGGMKLDTPFQRTARVGVAPRCRAQLVAGTQLVVSGWGSLSESSTTNVPNLHDVTVPIVNFQRCATAYQSIGIDITDTSLCAGTGNGDACSLDTGGPGIVNGQLCAVVSFGRGCNRPNFPGVYTDTTNPRVAQFITNTLAK